MIETKEIKMQPQKMLTTLCLLNGVPWLAGAFIGLVCLVILGMFGDFRFYILSLIWLFLFLPLLITFLYFIYGMKPLTAFNSIPHKLLFTDDKVVVKIISKDSQEDENGNQDLQNQTPEATGSTPDKNYEISVNDFCRIKSGSDFVILLTLKNGWLWLPVYAFDNQKDFHKVLKVFSDVRTN